MKKSLSYRSWYYSTKYQYSQEYKYFPFFETKDINIKRIYLIYLKLIYAKI